MKKKLIEQIFEGEKDQKIIGELEKTAHIQYFTMVDELLIIKYKDLWVEGFFSGYFNEYFQIENGSVEIVDVLDKDPYQKYDKFIKEMREVDITIDKVCFAHEVPGFEKK